MIDATKYDLQTMLTKITKTYEVKKVVVFDFIPAKAFKAQAYNTAAMSIYNACRAIHMEVTYSWLCNNARVGYLIKFEFDNDNLIDGIYTTFVTINSYYKSTMQILFDLILPKPIPITHLHSEQIVYEPENYLLTIRTERATTGV